MSRRADDRQDALARAVLGLESRSSGAGSPSPRCRAASGSGPGPGSELPPSSSLRSSSGGGSRTRTTIFWSRDADQYLLVEALVFPVQEAQGVGEGVDVVHLAVADDSGLQRDDRRGLERHATVDGHRTLRGRRRADLRVRRLWLRAWPCSEQWVSAGSAVPEAHAPTPSVVRPATDALEREVVILASAQAVQCSWSTIPSPTKKTTSRPNSQERTEAWTLVRRRVVRHALAWR